MYQGVAQGLLTLVKFPAPHVTMKILPCRSGGPRAPCVLIK